MAGTAVDTTSEVWAGRTNGAYAPDARESLADLYASHGKLVFGICRMLLRNREEAEDAAQQAFLSAYRNLLAGGQPRQPAAWLAAIARNECSARIRGRMREPLAVSDLEGEVNDHVTDVIRNSELWDAISELPEQQRRALLLRELGLTYGEMATELQVSEPAVESLLFRARTRLRGTLASVNGLLTLEAIRQLIARSAAGGAAGAPAAAKLATLPLASKLVAGGVAVTIAAGGAVAIKTDSAPATKRHTAKVLPVDQPPAQSSRPIAKSLAFLPVTTSAGRAVARHRSPVAPTAATTPRTSRGVAQQAPRHTVATPPASANTPSRLHRPVLNPGAAPPRSTPAVPTRPAPSAPVATPEPGRPLTPPPAKNPEAAPDAAPPASDPHTPHGHGTPPTDTPPGSSPSEPAHPHGSDPPAQPGAVPGSEPPHHQE